MHAHFIWPLLSLMLRCLEELLLSSVSLHAVRFTTLEKLAFLSPFQLTGFFFGCLWPVPFAMFCNKLSVFCSSLESLMLSIRVIFTLEWLSFKEHCQSLEESLLSNFLNDDFIKLCTAANSVLPQVCYTIPYSGFLGNKTVSISSCFGKIK